MHICPLLPLVKYRSGSRKCFDWLPSVEKELLRCCGGCLRVRLQEFVLSDYV